MIYTLIDMLFATAVGYGIYAITKPTTRRERFEQRRQRRLGKTTMNDVKKLAQEYKQVKSQLNEQVSEHEDQKECSSDQSHPVLIPH